MLQWQYIGGIRVQHGFGEAAGQPGRKQRGTAFTEHQNDDQQQCTPVGSCITDKCSEFELLLHEELSIRHEWAYKRPIYYAADQGTTYSGMVL